MILSYHDIPIGVESKPWARRTYPRGRVDPCPQGKL